MAKGEYVRERNSRLEVIRKKEIKQIEMGIRHQEYIVVASGPQGGLTTFFSQAISHISEVSDIRDYQAISLQATELKTPLFSYFAMKIAERLHGPKQGRWKRLIKKEKKGLDLLFEAAFGKSQDNIIFFIDNFHDLSIEKQQQFVRDIRQLHSYKSHSQLIERMLFVLGGALSWKKIDPQRISPFSNAASKITLQDFDFQETMEFVGTFFKKHNLLITEVAQEYIYEVTDGHPYFTGVLCKMILRSSEGDINFKQIDQAVHALLAEGDSHLRTIKEKLLGCSLEELQPLVSVMQGKVLRRSNLAPDPNLDNLILTGLLAVCKNHRIRIRNSVYSKFLRRDPMLQEKFKEAYIAPDELLCDHIISANKQGYCLINQLENELRNLIVSQLYLRFQENWLEQGMGSIYTESERDGNAAVKELDKVLLLRQTKEQADISLPYTEDPVIGYATLKELELIVVKNWKNIFKAIIVSQDRFKVYLTILNRIRNKLAHNRRITDEEINKLREIQKSFKNWLGGPL